ncbi:hypothetical protein V8E51_016766 [Hyaloscypha variabilis]
MTLLQPTRKDVGDADPPQNEDPYNAIPVATDIPKIIRLLHKISTAVDTYVLMYNGIKGAAWVITYACSVLGLNACALDKNGDLVPVAGKYEDAKVVIDLASVENNCQLYLAGATAKHLISLQEPEQFKRRGWSIDCSIVNFVDLQHPSLRNSESFTRLSHFVALETMRSVTAWAATFRQASVILPQTSSKIDIGFKPYTMSVLPILQERSLEILRMLGFRPSQLSDYNFVKADGCETHHPFGHKMDPVPRLRAESSGGVNPNSKQNYRAKFLSYDLEGQYVPYAMLLSHYSEPPNRQNQNHQPLGVIIPPLSSLFIRHYSQELDRLSLLQSILLQSLRFRTGIPPSVSCQSEQYLQRNKADEPRKIYLRDLSQKLLNYVSMESR